MGEEMKIGIDARVLQQDITGVGNNIIQIIKDIAKLDDTTKFFLFFSARPSSSTIRELGIFSKVIVPTKHGIVWEQIKVPVAIKKHEIDIYHAPWNVGLPFRKVCKYVVTINDLIPLEMEDYFASRKTKLFYRCRIDVSAKRSDKIITLSNYSKRKILEHFNVPKGKIAVVPCGVSNLFRPLQDLKVLEQVKEQYDLRDKFLLYVGGFDARKNIEVLIKAFDHYLRQTDRKDSRLVLVGAKNVYFPKLRELVLSLGISDKVTFTGYVPNSDLVSLYNLAEALVYPSSHEGFGLPPLEAMACGTPVITSNISSLPEVVGNAAILVNNPKSVAEITKAINLVLNDKVKRDEMIKLGLDRVKQFSWEKAALKTLQIYQELGNKLWATI